jgi:hypothetical protein
MTEHAGNCCLEALYVAKQLRGGDVAHQLIEAVCAFADGSAPPVSTASRGVQRPGTLPIRHPRPSDIVRRVAALNSPEDSARYDRRRRLPQVDSLRYAQTEIAVSVDFAQGPLVTPKREPQGQSRPGSATKINKKVVSKQVQSDRG